MPGFDIAYSFDPALGDFLWSDGSTDEDFSIDMGGTFLTINVCVANTPMT
jgi:hypothetical protein